LLFHLSFLNDAIRWHYAEFLKFEEQVMRKALAAVVFATAVVVCGMQNVSAMWLFGGGTTTPDEELLAGQKYAALSKVIYADLDALREAPMTRRRDWIVAQLETGHNPFLNYMLARSVFKHPGYWNYTPDVGFRHLLHCVVLTSVAHSVLVAEAGESHSPSAVTLAQFIKLKMLKRYRCNTSFQANPFAKIRNEVVANLQALIEDDAALAALPLPHWIRVATYGHKTGWGIGWADVGPEVRRLKDDSEFMTRLIAQTKAILAAEIESLRAMVTWKQYFSDVAEIADDVVSATDTGTGAGGPVAPSTLLSVSGVTDSSLAVIQPELPTAKKSPRSKASSGGSSPRLVPTSTSPRSSDISLGQGSPKELSGSGVLVRANVEASLTVGEVEAVEDDDSEATKVARQESFLKLSNESVVAVVGQPFRTRARSFLGDPESVDAIAARLDRTRLHDGDVEALAAPEGGVGPVPLPFDAKGNSRIAFSATHGGQSARYSPLTVPKKKTPTLGSTAKGLNPADRPPVPAEPGEDDCGSETFSDNEADSKPGEVDEELEDGTSDDDDEGLVNGLIPHVVVDFAQWCANGFTSAT
jgi:hypothetical protein